MKNLSNKIKRGSAMLLIGASLIGLNGCATSGNYSVENDIGYERFCARRGDYKIVSRGNDLYIEKIDGSDSRQITHTPDIKDDALFSADGKYIIIVEDVFDPYAKIRGKYYRIASDSDDSTRKQISLEECGSLAEKQGGQEIDYDEEE